MQKNILVGLIILLVVNARAAAENDPRSLNLSLLDAAKSGDTGLVVAGLRDGASVDTRDRFGNTALIYAARSGHIEIARLLIGAGADTDQTSVSGNTPLFEAAGSGDVAIVQLLLQHGNDPNSVNRKKVSPLANAIFQNHGDVAELLLDHGARPDIVDSTGKTSAVYAAANGQTEVLEQILALTADDKTGVNMRYSHNLTLLMWAAGYGNTATVAMLLDKGATIDLTDDRGKTAMMMAAENEHVDVVAVLRKFNAD